MIINSSEQFINLINDSIAENYFVKLVFMNKRNKSTILNTVSAKLISIKKGIKLSFVYHYTTSDITKNYSIQDCTLVIDQLLKNDFRQADLHTLKGDWHIVIHRNNDVTITKKSPRYIEPPELTHDKVKQRIISAENNIYLRELNIVNDNWKVKPDMQSKFRQINKYIEIIDGIMKNASLPNNFSIADMGAGKGYLTFALYDYCYAVLKKEPKITGIEYRKNLVDECNRIALLSGFSNLSFITGTIKDTLMEKPNMLIALHACNTATDDAIFRGINDNAEVIICAPCCHKQIRQQLNPGGDLQLINRYGILKERQAEIITDAIRALIMEAYGYKTKVFEFIETEHTPKNVIIAGVKTSNKKTPDIKILEQINSIKKIYGIGYHYLETLMNNADYSFLKNA